MVDQVFIARRQSEHPLADQRLDLVLNQFRAAKVAEAGGEAIDEADRPIGRVQKHRAGVRGDAPAVKSRRYRTSFDRFKFEQIRDTLCLHRGAPRIQLSF